MNMDPNYTQQPGGVQPGKGKAIAALVLGIIAIFLPIPFLDLACGIVGLVLASSAKKEGFTGGLRTAGFVLSIIGTIWGALYTLGWIIGGAAAFLWWGMF